MVEKLESAGLGFYVRATETQQKLGTDTVIYILYIVKFSLLYDCP